MEWMERLLEPNHILALQFYEGVVFFKVLMYEDQEYIFPLDGSRITVDTSTAGTNISDILAIPFATGQTKHLFDIDTEHKDEILHFFFGVEPYDLMIRMRYGSSGPKRYASMYGTATGFDLYEFVQSDFYNPSVKTELFGYFGCPKPQIVLYNPTGETVYARVRFVGRRYKVIPIPPEKVLTMEEIRKGRFALRKIGNIDALVKITPSRVEKTWGVGLVSLEELQSIMLT